MGETTLTASRLTDRDIARFHALGYYAPISVLSQDEALACRRKLEAFEAATGGPLSGPYRHKTHLLFAWLDALIRHPVLLDAAEAVLGSSDILVWGTSFFIKEARDPAFVSWHQDSTYWGLSHPDVVTAWVALSASTIESGAMRVIPGTHTRDQLPHRDTFDKENLLSRGQEVLVEVDEREAVDLPLRPGQASLHHVRLVHGSEPNRSDDRRIGVAIRYIPTYVRQTSGNSDSAMLVRGTDRFGNFELEQPPARDVDPETVLALERHARVTGQSFKILYRGAPQ
jgi:phytanoyl-CoA dioxygenase PhyH